MNVSHLILSSFPEFWKIVDVETLIIDELVSIPKQKEYASKLISVSLESDFF